MVTDLRRYIVLHRYRCAIESGDYWLEKEEEKAFGTWREAVGPTTHMKFTGYYPDAVCEVTGKREPCTEVSFWIQEAERLGDR